MVAQTCMANTGIVDLDADFVRFWCFNFNVFDGEVFACFPGYSSLEGRQLHAIKAPLGIRTHFASNCLAEKGISKRRKD